MFKKLQMEDCKPICTPMITGWKFNKHYESKEVHLRLCRSIIGNSLYVTTSRLDVVQAIGVVARFQSSPRENHVQAINRIFRYMEGILELGLWYPRGKELSLRTYSDSN